MQRNNDQFFEAIERLHFARMEMQRQTGFAAELKECASAMWRQRWVVIGVTVLALFLAVLYVRSATPLYTSVAEILIDPRKKELTEGEVVPSGLGSSALGADTALVESQVAIIHSESVMARIISRENLDQDPEFVGGIKSEVVKALVGTAKSVVLGDASSSAMSPYDRAKRKLLKRLKVKRKGNTYVVQIAMRSTDPEKAARISNGIAQIYVSESRRHSSNTTREAATELDSRLSDLREAAQAASQAVEDYRRENGLIGAQNLLVVEQQLRDTNNQLGLAQAATETAKSNLDEARRLAKRPLNGAVQSEVLESSVSNGLLVRLADARAREANLAVSYLPQHPQMQAAVQLRRSLETALRRDLARVTERYQVTYNVALQNQKAMERQLAKLQDTAAKSNSDGVRLRELEQEAASSRQVYETFLTRAKQVKEQIGLPTGNTRIISVAYATSKPSDPNPRVLLPAALVVGLLLGLLTAWLMYVFNPGPVQPTYIRPMPVSRQLPYVPHVFDGNGYRNV